MQILALGPGISRSGVAIAAGMRARPPPRGRPALLLPAGHPGDLRRRRPQAPRPLRAARRRHSTRRSSSGPSSPAWVPTCRPGGSPGGCTRTRCVPSASTAWRPVSAAWSSSPCADADAVHQPVPGCRRRGPDALYSCLDGERGIRDARARLLWGCDDHARRTGGTHLLGVVRRRDGCVPPLARRRRGRARRAGPR